jgi:hypothetical protein
VAKRDLKHRSFVELVSVVVEVIVDRAMTALIRVLGH